LLFFFGSAHKVSQRLTSHDIEKFGSSRLIDSANEIHCGFLFRS